MQMTVFRPWLMVTVALLAASGPASGGDGLSQINALPRSNPWVQDPHWSQLQPDVVTPHTP